MTTFEREALRELNRIANALEVLAELAPDDDEDDGYHHEEIWADDAYDPRALAELYA